MSNHNNSPSSFQFQHQQQRSEPTPSVDMSQKLEDELKELGHKIKHHEDNINYLQSHVQELEGEIMNDQFALTEFISTNKVREENASSGETEEVIIENILKVKKSAAAFLCRLKYKYNMPDHSLLKDVIGVVAILGETDDPKLSSVLSVFLGPETMLAVVCKTSNGAKALESYSKDGSIHKSYGIHAFAADEMGISLDDNFPVICLDDLRPYPGRFMDDDPHRRLDLMTPIVNGVPPTGFLGFAVNMVFIDNNNMYCMSKAGNTLRETLFYNLFSSLQVYRSKEDMFNAKPFISNGAVSLDGGIIRKNGVYLMGHQKREIDVKFPIRSRGSIHTKDYYETENRMKETNWKKSRTLEDLHIEQELLDHTKHTYELKTQEFLNFLETDQVGRASTSR